MEGLLPIGRFSRMSRLSIKALRLYDEHGLLIPAWVDRSSGYRYYRAAQAGHAEAIRILRSVDMPLDEIHEVLAEDDTDFTAKRLAMHRERLAAVSPIRSGDGFAVLMGALADAATQPIGAPFIIYHDVIDEQTDGEPTTRSRPPTTR